MASQPEAKAVVGCLSGLLVLLVTLPLWLILLFWILSSLNAPVWVWVCYWIYLPTTIVANVIAQAITKLFD